MREAGPEIIVDQLVVMRNGKRTVHGVSMRFRAGEITALLGANGAGKSSIVLAMGGAIPTASGHVWWNGRDLANAPPDQVRRAGVALVPEGHMVLGSMSVMDNLRVAAANIPARYVPEAIDRALTLFPELTTRLDVPAAALSGGQKQMLLIGQALVGQPRFILIDELSLGLAPSIVSRLAETIAHLAAAGMGIVLIEQFTTLALKLSRQAYIIERGTVAFSGPAQELRDNAEILNAAYLGRQAAEPGARR